MTRRAASSDVRCDYCQAQAVFHTTSTHIYGRDLGAVWHCAPCAAWVGCHPDDRPLGRLANKSLRLAKQAAHAAIDPMIEAKMRRAGMSRGQARRAGYKWLAAQLGLTRGETHIGLFDDAMCARVIEVCARRERVVERGGPAPADGATA